jgi:hypothetical protein
MNNLFKNFEMEACIAKSLEPSDMKRLQENEYQFYSLFDCSMSKIANWAQNIAQFIYR